MGQRIPSIWIYKSQRIWNSKTYICNKRIWTLSNTQKKFYKEICLEIGGQMNILEIISNKINNKELSKEEIEFFIKEYTNGGIADYQAASLVTAMFINGMTKKETTNLTLAMANSGEKLDLSTLGKTIVDKHSTGGVGDKVSLVLLPLVASCGVPVAKMSGRGLGFTGGTVDKLEAIPGYKTGISIKEFISNVEEIEISMISQTLNLAPADKKMYALRDSISCVESIPLIASSIMSKKIASGAQKIVLDVTCGKGAFMKNIEDSEKLANEMLEIGKLANRETVCILTNMNEPLGYSIGNILEVKEAIKALQGDMPEDLKQVVLELGGYMLKLGEVANTIEEAKQKLQEQLENGKAYEKFLELVAKQGGDVSYIEDTSKIEKAKYIEPVIAEKNGYINEIDAEKVGKLACMLGAGRIKKEDKIDPLVGIILEKKVANKVNQGEILAYIHSNNKEKLEESKKELLEIIKIKEEKIEKEKVILKIMENVKNN
jgi:pyrimidine-nucleoside phosphorylase